MIKLLIADDEEDIRKGILQFIDWEFNDIRICGEAEDGMQALELIQKLQPDIVLLDIRMPEMTGLEVVEAIQARNLPTKSIIISGYDDFSYAQEALRLGVSHYLLKPCRPEDILDTVKRVKEDIEAAQLKRELYQKMKAKLNENLPLMKDQYLLRFVSKESIPRRKIAENFDYYNIKIKPQHILVSIISIDNTVDLNEKMDFREMELMRFAVKNILSEAASSYFLCEVFENKDGIILIANVENNNLSNEFIQVLEKARKFIRDNLDFTISIGVGTKHEDINDICLSYEEAIRALDWKFLSGSDSLMLYENLPVDSMSEELEYETYYPIHEEKELLSSIRSSNSAEIDKALKAFFIKLNSRKLSKNNILKICFALLFSLYHLCLEVNISSEKIFGQGLSMIHNFLKRDTLSKIKENLSEISHGISESINHKKSSNKIIEQSLEYINQNFCKDLNLEKVAGNVFVNPKYYCFLFKQTMGINFIDYINTLRIEKACELLRDIRLKTYEIAHQVGYSDEKYFSQIFRKLRGMTPSQFRGSIKF